MILKTKILSVIVFLTFSVVGFAQNECSNLRGCERKLCELNRKLGYAKQYGRYGQIRGLENAIYHTKRNCNSGYNYNNNYNTDYSSNYDNNYGSNYYKNDHYYGNDIDKKIRDKEKKVRERQEELDETIMKNERREKIEKRKRKLEEAIFELEQVKKYGYN